MANYIEITTLSDIKRKFYDKDTGEIIECICPFSMPKDKMKPVNRKCKIHGE